MTIKSKFIIFLLLIAPVLLPYKVIALANPAATSCVDSGGDYQIITNSDGSQSGKCVYFGGFECSSYEFFKGNGCFYKSLIFGTSSFWWGMKIVLVVALVFVIYKIYEKFKRLLSGRKN